VGAGLSLAWTVEDVGRKESDALGLTEPKEKLAPIDKQLNDQLHASTRDLDPRLVNFLKLAFGDHAVFTADAVKWKGYD
jgi:hypothetical protein